MNRRTIIAVLAGLSACAASPLRDARQMGVTRDGGLRADPVALIALDIQVHDDAPRTLPRQPTLRVPALPAVDGAALDAAAIETLQRVGTSLGVSVLANEPTVASTELPARLAALMDANVPAALGLTVHVGWCPVGDVWAACVRSPDTALGYGPPAIEGFIYGRFRAKHGAAIARRVGVVRKDFVYEVDPSGAHLDRPFVGVGETFQQQSEDAVRQAVRAWMTVARGRRGQRILDAATAD